MLLLEILDNVLGLMVNGQIYMTLSSQNMGETKSNMENLYDIKVR